MREYIDGQTNLNVDLTCGQTGRDASVRHSDSPYQAIDAGSPLPTRHHQLQKVSTLSLSAGSYHHHQLHRFYGRSARAISVSSPSPPHTSFQYLFLSRPLSVYWTLSRGPNNCIDETAHLLAAGIISTTTDFVVIILFMTVVFRLENLTRRQIIAINALFCVGLLACAAGVVRTYLRHLDHNYRQRLRHDVACLGNLALKYHRTQLGNYEYTISLGIRARKYARR